MSPNNSTTVSANSSQEHPASIKDFPWSSKPLVFLDSPDYPIVDGCHVSGYKQHGTNQYSLFTLPDQERLFQALQLRCHSMRRLTQKKFLIAENFSSWPDLHLPDGINLRDIAMTPASSHRCPRQVVAIDCEMVAVGSGRFEGGKEKERNELAQLCAVDVLTGVVLIDKLVLPREKVLNWNTRYSGVSYPKICAARESGRLLRGWQAARAELLSFIDVNTIIVGHAVENDLHILRIAHSKIVDTSIQTAEAVYGDTERLGRTWGLKELAKSLPGLFVQVEKKKGHDCVEDTLATREIALWCLNHHPELAEWATRMRVELENKRVEREKKKEEDRKKTEAQNEVPAGQGWPQIPLPPLGFELSQGTSDNLNQLDASY